MRKGRSGEQERGGYLLAVVAHDLGLVRDLVAIAVVLSSSIRSRDANERTNELHEVDGWTVGFFFSSASTAAHFPGKCGD